MFPFAIIFRSSSELSGTGPEKNLKDRFEDSEVRRFLVDKNLPAMGTWAPASGTGLRGVVGSGLRRVDVIGACVERRTALQKQASSRVYRFYDRVSRR